MFYPLKFKSVYKDYIWGGKNLSLYKKDIPQEKVAESWEISCHPDGESVIDNGRFLGLTLNELIKKYRTGVVGARLPYEYIRKFPLLVKLIDANDRLSVQVHPDDEYARNRGFDEYGKNEMWYILEVKPGSKLVYGLKEGITREKFIDEMEKGNIESCLNYIEVSAGDSIHIPAGTVHAIGEGIVLAEIQQNSNLTFRVFDYNRRDKDGNLRELHIGKALEAINFKSDKQAGIGKGHTVIVNENIMKTYLADNQYFSVRKYAVNGHIVENADGSRFYIYTILNGQCEVEYKNGIVKLSRGESTLIPAYMGYYNIKGPFHPLCKSPSCQQSNFYSSWEYVYS